MRIPSAWLLAGGMWLSSVSLLAGGPASSAPLSNAEAGQLVQRVADAARLNSYHGIYVHQYGDRFETVRVVHLADGARDIERRETLDGPPLEMLREGDKVGLYLPEDAYPASVDRRLMSKLFPRQWPEQAQQLLAGYQIRRAGHARVAGVPADIYEFEPRDRFRYPHRYWVHPESGLMLKSMMIGPRNEPIELFTFSQIQIGGTIDRKLLKPNRPLRTLPLESGEGEAIRPQDPEWEVRSLPPGFRLVKTKRSAWAKGRLVTHHLYSDGLVTVSAFIEPLPRANAAPSLAQQGGISFFSRQLGTYLLTVVGEVPTETVQLLSNAYTLREPAAAEQ
ncbi:MucB/RseB C-terminal domain-containing protein [Chitiniphilus purpureus]|uniref:MucB/RseB C-terminal domain-containing protein n=1 Tax=Chitiniphilus purpureus TaxID=2981137 RepID=A0ABY6DJZ8_9NEIS|nr:MucB/RseB C-terminal domain-containing protein [Chitiniphilus sp. CD1]UXY13766.1 MucB/RseB C-terminal domain-containing protein [Chitiniphilus sp. CD1]